MVGADATAWPSGAGRRFLGQMRHTRQRSPPANGRADGLQRFGLATSGLGPVRPRLTAEMTLSRRKGSM